MHTIWTDTSHRLPFANEGADVTGVPLSRPGDDHQTLRSHTLPQLHQPGLGLHQTLRRLKQDQVKAFNLIRDPGQLEVVGTD